MTTLDTSTIPDEKKGAYRWVGRELFGLVWVFALLFGAAGRFDWPGAWLMLAVYAVWIGANIALLLPRAPGLLAERARRQLSATRSDSIILGVYGVSVLAKYILAGLQQRWHAPLDFGLPLTLLGLLLAAGGYALVTWSMWANHYFSMVLRIQTERSQVIATGGPYAILRHPGYLGSLLFELGSPLLLGSTWALPFGLLNAALMVVRTALEDRYLQANLPGYPDYSTQTRWKLLPGIW